MNIDWSAIMQTASVVVVVIIFILSNIENKKILKREIYQRLEFASIDLFRFEMEQSDKCWKLYNKNFNIAEEADDQTEQDLTNHITQILNLFEMSTELHNKKIIDDKIFSTWVPWIFEIANYRNFQYLWKEDLNKHYTKDLYELIEISINNNYAHFIETICQIKHYHGLRRYLTEEMEDNCNG
jgi:hypothetical protein